MWEILYNSCMATPKKLRDKWRVQVQVNGQRTSKVFNTEEEARQWLEMETKLRKIHSSSSSMMERLQYADLAIMTSIPKRVLRSLSEIPFSQQQILDAALPMGTQVGIYFLVKHDEIVYVGQSIDIFRRIGRHKAEGRDFDSFTFIQCEQEKLDYYESLYIGAFVPEQNVSLKALRNERHKQKALEIATAMADFSS
jgi:predicted GIY-YIG superfamily endonuclease